MLGQRGDLQPQAPGASAASSHLLLWALALGATLFTGCSPEPQTSTPQALVTQHDPKSDTESVVNIYNWADYIGSSVIAGFEKKYGVKVNYDVYDSNEVLETKLLTGHTGYDLVVPSGYFFEHQRNAGVYQLLDPSQLPNLKNLDPAAARWTAVYDPGHRYAVTYSWLASTGIAYDRAKIQARLPDAPVHSWRLFFDPSLLVRFKDCGISVLDSPTNVVAVALIYRGKNPNSDDPADLKVAEELLMSIRGLIRYVDSTRYMEDLANGEICLSLGWSGDVAQSRLRAREAGKGVDLEYSIPQEGSVSGVDVLAIPADAPHPHNAHLFINYLLRPEVAAVLTNELKYASGVAIPDMLLNPAVRDDPAVYPAPEVRTKLIPLRTRSPESTRRLMRLWTRFKTGI